MNANIYEKANQIVRDCDTAYLGLIDDEGYPSVSTVSTIKTESIFEIFASTNIGSNKEKRIRKNSRASICFCSKGSNVTLVGEAEIVTDQETKSRCWLDWFGHHYQGGETDPDYVVIKFKTRRVSLWIDSESAEFTIDALMSVQSYCGTLCDGCPYRESHGCKGCIALKGNPFWGECPVAKCCKSKGFRHCGECPDIPCDELKEFSCGDSEHSDSPKGARISVCNAWADKV